MGVGGLSGCEGVTPRDITVTFELWLWFLPLCLFFCGGGVGGGSELITSESVEGKPRLISSKMFSTWWISSIVSRDASKAHVKNLPQLQIVKVQTHLQCRILWQNTKTLPSQWADHGRIGRSVGSQGYSPLQYDKLKPSSWGHSRSARRLMPPVLSSLNIEWLQQLVMYRLLSGDKAKPRISFKIINWMSLNQKRVLRQSPVARWI